MFFFFSAFYDFANKKEKGKFVGTSVIGECGKCGGGDARWESRRSEGRVEEGERVDKTKKCRELHT